MSVLGRAISTVKRWLHLPISALSLDCLTRDLYGAFDPAAIAQLAPLAENTCYQPKFYKGLATSDEVVAANGYASYGMKVTPGSIIYAIGLPPVSLTSPLPQQFNIQVTDQSLKMPWYDQPIPSYFVGNCKPTYLSSSQDIMGSAPNFLVAPYPVVGNGLFLVEVWEISGSQQRIQPIFFALEPVGNCS
jgi:hypothetical protein